MISTVHVLCSIRSSSPGYHLFLQVLSSDRVSCFHCSSFRILHWRKKKKNKKTPSDMTALGFSCWLNKGCNQWLWSSLIRQQFQSEHTVLRAQDRIDHCLHTGLQPKTPKKSMRQQIQSKQDPTLIFTIYPAHVSANHCNCFSNRSHSDSISKHQNEVF